MAKVEFSAKDVRVAASIYCGREICPQTFSKWRKRLGCVVGKHVLGRIDAMVLVYASELYGRGYKYEMADGKKVKIDRLLVLNLIKQDKNFINAFAKRMESAETVVAEVLPEIKPTTGRNIRNYLEKLIGRKYTERHLYRLFRQKVLTSYGRNKTYSAETILMLVQGILGKRQKSSIDVSTC